MKKLLIVDDEINMQKVLKILFQREKYQVYTASNGAEAVSILESGETFDLILSDMKMPVMDGLDFLRYLENSQYSIPFILVTAYGTISEAVDAMKHGAIDFITKPFNKEDLKKIVHRSVYGAGSSDLVDSEKFHNDEGVIYRSDNMSKIMETVRKIASSNLSILLTGESGTGKGIITEAIHSYTDKLSGFKTPFVNINCPALPDTLLESELFGYKKGAFTGAEKDFPGKISMADGGTLFLDEIGDLSLTVQSKLLKLLEEGVYSPLGSTKEYRAKIRIVSATNQSIPNMIKEKTFREDLYYRINSVILDIPSLRDRKEDIEPLADFFTTRFSVENGKDIKGISKESKKSIFNYDWPGNIRELRNVIHRAVVLTTNSKLMDNDFPDFLESDDKDSDTTGNLYKDNERELVLSVLEKNSWNISATARDLGLSRGSLRHRMNKYSL